VTDIPNQATDGAASKTMLEELARDAARFDVHTIQAIADVAIRKIARLEGYSDGLAEQLRKVRRAAGCNHD
jgi:hypothetical protein